MSDIDFTVYVDVYKTIDLAVFSYVDLDGWTADAGADATADAGCYDFFTMAEAYTDAHTEVGFSEASSFSGAAIDAPDWWCG